jgi:hypothetical protein
MECAATVTAKHSHQNTTGAPHEPLHPLHCNDDHHHDHLGAGRPESLARPSHVGAHHDALTPAAPSAPPHQCHP